MNVSIFVAAGFAVAAAFMIWHEKSRQKRLSQEYDEMQLRIRGKGAWYSFYTMVLYAAIYMLLERMTSFSFLSASDALFLGAIICGSVNAGYAILHDSYYGMDKTAKNNSLFLILVALMEVLSVYMLIWLLSEGAFSDLSQTIRDERLLIVLCLPLFTTILITTFLRRFRGEESEE